MQAKFSSLLSVDQWMLRAFMDCRNTRSSFLVDRFKRSNSLSVDRRDCESMAAAAGMLGSLPEDCIHLILSFTTPRDVGRAAAVNRALYAASQSDLVWKSFLPPRSLQVADHDAHNAPLQYASNQDLYRRLCSPVLLKNGVQKYWLDHSTGQECHILSARALSITWGEDERYWSWIPLSDSWFHEVAYLKQVCWFEVKGTFHHLFQPGKYTISFRIKMSQVLGHIHGTFWGHRHGRVPVALARGWDLFPVKFSLSISNGYHRESECFLNKELRSSNPDATSLTLLRAANGWIECDIGEFTVEDTELPLDLEFSMVQIEGGNWKTGLILDGLIIQPSTLVSC